MESTVHKLKRKQLSGVVQSAKMNKTVVVKVQRTMRHPQYGKVVHLNKNFYAHDETNSCKAGDQVTIIETRPLSKLKRWRVVSETNA